MFSPFFYFECIYFRYISDTLDPSPPTQHYLGEWEINMSTRHSKIAFNIEASQHFCRSLKLRSYYCLRNVSLQLRQFYYFNLEISTVSLFKYNLRY